MQQIKLKQLNREHLKELAKIFASHSKRGDVICVNGDLGAGKTTFAQMFIKHCTNETNILSPTFNMLQIYSHQQFDIYHYDFYRLTSYLEAYELGIEDAFDNNLTIIEWSENIKELLPESRININLMFTENDFNRDVIIINSKNYDHFMSLIIKNEGFKCLIENC